MINTNELMLGDLVRLPDGQIAKVIAIDATGNVDVEFETDHFCHHVWAHAEDIKCAILLTEEILLKNGFKRTGSFSDIVEYTLTEIENILCIFYNRDCEKPYFYADIANVVLEIEYVYELQHLLRLCGWDDIANHLKI